MSAKPVTLRPSQLITAFGPGAMVEAPLHPRGSTLIDVPSHSISAGSPAPAGIDPQHLAASVDDDRLPRTRGDRPFRATLMG